MAESPLTRQSWKQSVQVQTEQVCRKEVRIMAAVRLPTFKGWTVDYSLRQFRKLIYGKKVEFVPFDSPKGQRLLAQIAKQGLTTFAEEL
jgi:hypothetical protein